MELDNFYLEKYTTDDYNHRTTIIELENDKDARLYLGNLENWILRMQEKEEIGFRNNAYIAYYKDNPEPIGFISLTKNTERYEISYGIRPKYRGEHLAALLLQEFSETVFNTYSEINELTLNINNLNTPSKKTADLVGFEKETSTRHVQRRV